MNNLTRNQKILLIVAAVLIVCLVIAGIAVVVVMLRNDSPTPEPPTATPMDMPTLLPSATPLPSAVPTPVDAVWANIQEKGEIAVGISADYPPFAFVGDDFTIQGYDLALVSEVGKRLDLPLNIKNMAFDGLFNALQLNEIDLAIAAISRTAERDKFVDFSNVYLVSEDMVLAREDANITVSKVEDMAAYRVGVQSGSVYQTWLTQELVDPGLMPPSRLVTFSNAEDAAENLASPNPSIDLLMVGALPGEVAARSLPLKIVVEDLNAQLYAMAMPHGSPILQDQVNNALTSMVNDGTLAQLGRDFLNLDNLPPLPTPPPTAAPETPTACLDSFQLVQDLTYPDFNMTNPPQFPPGSPIQKGWRIRNTGTCTWNSAYQMTYVGSNPANLPLGGNPVRIQGQVAPGQTTDVYVDIFAPSMTGTFQSFWTMRNPSGLFFGERLWAGFMVIGAATSTPQPSAPTIYRFLASPSQINEGQCTDIQWKFGGQDIVRSRIFRNGERILKDMPFESAFSDCPPGTGQVEYRLQVDTAAAGSAQALQYVEVNPEAEPTDTPFPTEAPPVIIEFQVNPDEIEMGVCVDIIWSFEGQSLALAQLFRDGVVILQDLPFQGNTQDCPDYPGQIAYRLLISSEFGGTTERTRYLNVLAPLQTDN